MTAFPLLHPLGHCRHDRVIGRLSDARSNVTYLCEAPHSCSKADFLYCAISGKPGGRDMNYAVSVAERAILSVDHFLNRAMTYAWTSTLQNRYPGKELP